MKDEAEANCKAMVSRHQLMQHDRWEAYVSREVHVLVFTRVKSDIKWVEPMKPDLMLTTEIRYHSSQHTTHSLHIHTAKQSRISADAATAVYDTLGPFSAHVN